MIHIKKMWEKNKKHTRERKYDSNAVGRQSRMEPRTIRQRVTDFSCKTQVLLWFVLNMYWIHAMSFKTYRENVLEFEACEKHMPHRKSPPQISLHFVVSESPLNFQINFERPQAWLYYIEWMCISNKTIVPILISELIIHIHGIIVSKPKKVRFIYR